MPAAGGTNLVLRFRAYARTHECARAGDPLGAFGDWKTAWAGRTSWTYSRSFDVPVGKVGVLGTRTRTPVSSTNSSASMMVPESMFVPVCAFHFVLLHTSNLLPLLLFSSRLPPNRRCWAAGRKRRGAAYIRGHRDQRHRASQREAGPRSRRLLAGLLGPCA